MNCTVEVAVAQFGLLMQLLAFLCAIVGITGFIAALALLKD